jgi:hypothetical protein
VGVFQRAANLLSFGIIRGRSRKQRVAKKQLKACTVPKLAT